jgi:hypothetical protein
MKKVRKAQVLEIKVQTLIERLFSLVELKKKGGKVDLLIDSTEELLEEYAELVARGAGVQVKFMEED